jgi:hypothetical protein
MQETALAQARLGGDGIEREVRDPLAHDDRFGGVQQAITQRRHRSFDHGQERYRPAGRFATVQTVFLERALSETP